MREFVTAIEQTDVDADKGMEFAVDGFECVAYRPQEGQLAVLMAATAKHTTIQEQIAGVINFFVNVLDEESHQYLVSRLLDRTDSFGLEEVQDIMEWMIEEWAGRPTSPPSVSTRSQRSGGQKSKRPTTKSTSSALAQTGS